MENQELIKLVDDLLREGRELSWLEFKEGDVTDNQRLGRYISALSNAANLAHRPYGYLIFGVKDSSLEVVGTNERNLIKNIGTRSLPKWVEVVKE